MPTVATSRRSLALQCEDDAPGVHVLAPQSDRWQFVPLPADGTGVVTLQVEAQGIHRVFLGGAEATPIWGQEDLRLVVDRAAPHVEFSTTEILPQEVHQPLGVVVSWRVLDPLPIPDGVELFLSEDDGQEWQLIPGKFGKAGDYRWPPTSAPREQHRFRIVATDLAGNRVDQIFRLIDPAEPTVDEGELAKQEPEVVSEQVPTETETQVGEAKSSGSERAPDPVDPDLVSSADPAPPVPVPVPRLEWFPGAKLWSQEDGTDAHWFAGGSKLAIPAALEEVRLESATGSFEALQQDGNAVELPLRDGGPYRIVARQGPHELRSPVLYLDSSPPKLEHWKLRGTATGVSFEWRIRDRFGDAEASVAVPQLVLELGPAEGDPQVHEHPGFEGAGQHIAAPGTYVVRCWATNRVGLRSAIREEVVLVGARGPRLLNFFGESFGVGTHHTVFVRAGDPGAVESDVTLRAVAVDTEEVLMTGTIPRTATSYLWEIPARPGRYWFELHWVDPYGADRSSRAPEPFVIDGTAPRIAWGAPPPVVRDSVKVKLLRPGDDPEPIQELRFSKRRWNEGRSVGEDTGWTPLALPPVDPVNGASGPFDGASLEVEWDVSTWPEGSWQLGVVAVDLLGNQTEAPLESPTFVVDRTAPDLRTLVLPSAVFEGTQIAVELRSEERPGASEALWLRENAAVVTRAIRWQGTAPQWTGSLEALPPGAGRLLVVVPDQAGNNAERSAELTVRRAVLDLRIESLGEVDPAGPVFVRYELDPDYPLEAEPLLLTISAQAQPGDEAQQSEKLESEQPELESDELGARRQQPSQLRLAAERKRVVLHAPAEPGNYEIRIANTRGVQFPAPVLPLVVRDGPATLAGQQTPDPDGVRVEPSSARTVSDPMALSPAALQLIDDFKSYQRRWQGGERSPELRRERERLLRSLQGAVLQHPRQVTLRRALGRLLSFSEPPSYDEAVWVLTQGVRAEGAPEDVAKLLADAGLIEWQRQRFDEAERLLLEAVALEDRAQLRHSLGQIYTRGRQPVRAEIQLRMAVELQPNRTLYLYAWADSVAALPQAARQRGVATLEDWLRRGLISAAQRRDLELRFEPIRQGQEP